jgi:O-antigen ligase
MKDLLPGNDSLANKISFFHIMLLLLSLPFDLFYSHVILISLCIHTIIQLKKGNIKPVFTARVLAVQAVFFVTIIATIYTQYPQQAFAEWGREVIIFIIPLIFCLNSLDIKKYRPLLLFIFAIGCTLTVLYLYADAFFTIKFYKIPLNSIFAPQFTNHNFSEPIAIHATFFSMQLVIALVFMIYYLLNYKISSPLKIIYAACCFILLAGLVQLGSKSILITLFLVFALVFPYFMPTWKKRLQFISVVAAISVITLGAIFSNTTFRAKYINDMQTDLSPLKPGQNSEPRLARWEVISSVIKSSPIIGHGSGSEITILSDQFFNHKLYDSYIEKLNAHNQYLSFLLKSGIWGLPIYLAVLIYGFKIALQHKDVLFVSFMLLVAILSLSENILDVDKGVFFYGFFFTFFLFSYPQKNNPSAQNNLKAMATN